MAPECLKAELLPPRPGFHRRIEHAPLGVVFNISAWNYPLIIPINVIVPALAAGNAVVLKHSAKTPLVGRRLEEAFGADRPCVLTIPIDYRENALLTKKLGEITCAI